MSRVWVSMVFSPGPQPTHTGERTELELPVSPVGFVVKASEVEPMLWEGDNT